MNVQNEVKTRKNWGCLWTVSQTHVKLEIALEQCRKWMVAENAISGCCANHTNFWNVSEVSNLSSKRSSGLLPFFPVMIKSGRESLKTFALCDSGASLSFIVESLMKALNLTGQPNHLNVAGIDGTSDVSSKRFRVNIGDQNGTADESILG